MSSKILATISLTLLVLDVSAQVISGSDGHDGSLSPTENMIMNMAGHLDGIYHYSEINIPQGVTVSFLPNSNNTPLILLVQSNCVIAGTLSVNGTEGADSVGSKGGPGGWRGGNGAPRAGFLPESGYGPGGGKIGEGTNWYGGNASHSTLGSRNTNELHEGNNNFGPQHFPGDLYGNPYGIPLLGGSGGTGGIGPNDGGGGGGGAVLVVVGGHLTVSGIISARGGNGYYRAFGQGGWSQGGYGGAGSGGTIRIVASNLSGNGLLDAGGGSANYGIVFGQFSIFFQNNDAGDGRVRIEALSDTFSGSTRGTTTRGYTGIIFAPTNQQSQLFVRSVAGQPVSTSPTGSVITPDTLIGSQQLNPVSIAVTCINIPLNSDIIVEVRPSNGPYVSAVGRNSSGVFAQSTATVLLNIPRGGGTIQAKVATAN